MNPNVMIWLAFTAMAAGLLLFAIWLYVTRRDVNRIDARILRLEGTHVELLKEIGNLGSSIRSDISMQSRNQSLSADKRSTALHNRINPVTTNLSEIKGMMEAFTQSFNNFTEIITHQKKAGRDAGAPSE